MIVAALAIALVAVTVLVLTSNQITEREAEVASLEARRRRRDGSRRRAAPYADFASLSQARDATVTSLAQSRFDWERVLRRARPA